MSLLRSGVSLLLGLTALAAPSSAVADPPDPETSISVARPVTAPAPIPSAPPQPPVVTERQQRVKQAMVLHDEAWVLYAEGRYRAAIDRLEAALRIDPEGRELVYNLALIHEKLADLKDAIGYYRKYLQMEPDLRTKARIQDVLRRLEGAEKEADAVPSPTTAPFRFSMVTPPPLRPVRPWVVATGSVAGAAFLTGVICGFSALAKNPGPNARTGDGVTIGELQGAAHVAHVEAVAADVSLLVAAVAAGTAMFLYFSMPRRVPAGALAALAGRARVSF
jgi:tetratricopeptide (TPR) repeat protein